MRRLKSVLIVLAMLAVLSASAVPALAANRNNNWDWNNNRNWNNWNWNNWNNGNWNNWNWGNGFFTPSISNGVGQESETGNVTENFSVDQSGSNSSQCVTPQQFGNTGSFQNGQPVLQYNSISDGFFGDIQPEGGDFTFAPSLSGGCNQSVEQSAAAG